MRLLSSAIIAILLTSPQISSAESTLPTKHDIQRASESPQWQGLLQFFKTGFGITNTSQADDAAFFISPQGHANAAEELSAEINIFSNSAHPEYKITACKFPARFFWIQQQFPQLQMKMPSCPEFEEFQSRINIKDTYLVFPVAYLNSPSSMFGHTFLRLKAKDKNNPLLDYAVNFAADADPSENMLTYSIRGLAGGYPGKFSVVPYYTKIKEYSYLDSRDIWEYKLNLTTEEQAQMVRHIWELKNTNFDYYFLSENCSYRLMTLLAAVSDRVDISDEYKFRTIPADTIRLLDQQIGFSAIKYRPSQVTELRFREKGFKKQDINMIKDAVINPETNPTLLLGLHNPIAALDLAYDYARFVAAKEKSDLPHLSKRSMQLLSLRSKQGKAKELSIPPPPARDDQGHKTLSLTPAFGHSSRGNYTDFSIRGAYHDRLDVPRGYPTGAQLELFNLKLRYEHDSDDIQLQEFAFVNIHSQTPVTNLVKPKSWSVGFGFQHQNIEDRLGGYVKGSVGRTWGWDNLTLSLMAAGDLVAFDDTGFIELGPQLELNYQHHIWSGFINTGYFENMNRQLEPAFKSEIGIAKHDQDWQVRLTGEYESSNDIEYKELALGFRFYL
ncbi:MAG: DUF4105 domain-containing protein [Pseudomonadota bacterium]|nr:DUF4105 domain-containing protein [Pseudomonadota bacterium]